MTSEDLNKLLIERFPNLQERYFEEIGWQEGHSTGSHVIYGDVFTPYLVECIVNDNIEEVKKAFCFLEEVLQFDDKYSGEVIAFSVLESISYLLDKRDFLKKLLGNNSKELLDTIN